MLNKENMLKTMYEMQKIANNYTNGEVWIEGVTELGLEINWSRCMRMELVEAIDQSINWKHWKSVTNGQYSYADGGLHNVKIELVDVLHFLMSEIIKEDWVNDLMPFFNSISEETFGELKGKDLVLALEDLEFKVMTYERDNTFQNMEILFKEFWGIVLSIMPFEDTYEMYVLKNTLNLFRQKNGYKNGVREFDKELNSKKYVKNWGPDSIEDNIFLDMYLKDHGQVSYEEIDAYLEAKYKELNIF